MIIKHKIEPRITSKVAQGPLEVYGCHYVRLEFMLDIEGLVDEASVVELLKRMTEAACRVIEEKNKEDAQCPGQSEGLNAADGTLSEPPPEKSSVILPPNETPS